LDWVAGAGAAGTALVARTAVAPKGWTGMGRAPPDRPLSGDGWASWSSWRESPVWLVVPARSLDASWSEASASVGADATGVAPVSAVAAVPVFVVAAGSGVVAVVVVVVDVAGGTLARATGLGRGGGAGAGAGLGVGLAVVPVAGLGLGRGAALWRLLNGDVGCAGPDKGAPTGFPWLERLVLRGLG
jgi:hypothetical protein